MCKRDVQTGCTGYVHKAAIRVMLIKSRRYGERDVHAVRIANPCLVCGMHSYDKRTEEPGGACRSRS